MLRLTAFTKSIDMWVFYKNEIVIRWISCTICTISNFLSYYIRENGLLLSPSLLIIDTTPILKNNLLILHHLFSIYKFTHCKHMLKDTHPFSHNLLLNIARNQGYINEPEACQLPEIEKLQSQYSVLKKFPSFLAI